MERLAAVDHDRLARDEVGSWPAEVDDCADDVLGQLIALQRACGDGDVAQLLDHLGVRCDAGRHREAGCAAVHEDVVLPELLGQCAREGDDRGLEREPAPDRTKDRLLR